MLILEELQSAIERGSRIYGELTGYGATCEAFHRVRLDESGIEPARVTEPVSLMDVGPTVMDLMGVVTPASFMGQSLLPYLRGERPSFERPVIVDSGRHQRALIFEDGFKLIHDRRRGTVELYNLRTDPAEERNLADEVEHDIAVRLAALNEFFARHELRRDGYETPWLPP